MGAISKEFKYFNLLKVKIFFYDLTKVKIFFYRYYIKSIELIKSTFIAILYNFDIKKSVEVWDLSDLTVKNQLLTEITDAISVTIDQIQIIVGFSNNTLKRWNYFQNDYKEIQVDGSEIFGIASFVDIKFGTLLLISTMQNLLLFDLNSNSKEIVKSSLGSIKKIKFI